MVSWFSKKHSYVTLNIVEVEYIATSAASKETLWLRKVLAYLHSHELDVTVIFCDNQS